MSYLFSKLFSPHYSTAPVSCTFRGPSSCTSPSAHQLKHTSGIGETLLEISSPAVSSVLYQQYDADGVVSVKLNVWTNCTLASVILEFDKNMQRDQTDLRFRSLVCLFVHHRPFHVRSSMSHYYYTGYGLQIDG